MTKNQIAQFNRMRLALLTISKGYQTPTQIKKSANKDFGVDSDEVIEMAYENIQTTAADAVRGIKELKETRVDNG